MGRKKMTKTEKVWAYLIKNPTATAKEVASQVGCTTKLVYTLRKKIGTPQEVFEAEAQPKQRTRVKLLSQASALVDGDREKEHGDFRVNAVRIARYWNAHLDLPEQMSILPTDVPVMMTLLKAARLAQNPDRMDNYRDAAGYIALAGELAGGK
jgi:hypothetical protein